MFRHRHVFLLHYTNIVAEVAEFGLITTVRTYLTLLLRLNILEK